MIIDHWNVVIHMPICWFHGSGIVLGLVKSVFLIFHEIMRNIHQSVGMCQIRAAVTNLSTDHLCQFWSILLILVLVAHLCNFIWILFIFSSFLLFAIKKGDYIRQIQTNFLTNFYDLSKLYPNSASVDLIFFFFVIVQNSSTSRLLQEQVCCSQVGILISPFFLMLVCNVLKRCSGARARQAKARAPWRGFRRVALKRRNLSERLNPSVRRLKCATWVNQIRLVGSTTYDPTPTPRHLTFLPVEERAYIAFAILSYTVVARTRNIFAQQTVCRFYMLV